MTGIQTEPPAARPEATGRTGRFGPTVPRRGSQKDVARSSTSSKPSAQALHLDAGAGLPAPATVKDGTGMRASPPSRPRAHRQHSGLALVVLASVLWGTTGIASRFVPSDLPIPAHTLGFFRLTIGAPLLFCSARLLLGRRGSRLERRHAPLAVLFGAMIACYQIAFFTAVQHLGVAVGTLIPVGTSPLFAAAIARLVLQEHPPAGVLLASVAAIAGVACLTGVLADPWNLSTLDPVGAGAGLAGGMAWALVTVLGRLLVQRSAPPLVVTAVGFAIGGALLLPLAIGDVARVAASWQAWPAILYLGTVPSAMAYLLYTRGMGLVRTTAAGVTTILLEPACAVALAFLLLGERLGPRDWAGTLLLLLALALLFRGERRAG